MTTIRTYVKYDATTLLKYSPRKARLIINPIRGLKLGVAMEQLQFMKKGQSKQVHKLLKNAATNLGVIEGDYNLYKINSIVAEEAQKLFRVMPHAKGRADRITRRYSRIKVEIASA